LVVDDVPLVLASDGSAATPAAITDAAQLDNQQAPADCDSDESFIMLDSDSDLVLETLPSIMSYWKLTAASSKTLAEVLFKAGLVALFAAGTLRTSVASLLYAALSIGTLYFKARVGLDEAFLFHLILCTSVIACGMFVFHLVVNLSSRDFSPMLLQVSSPLQGAAELLNLMQPAVDGFLHYFANFNRTRIFDFTARRSCSAVCAAPQPRALPALCS
jgi:hypothetical protein